MRRQFTVLLLLFFPYYLWAQNWQQEVARAPQSDFFQIQRAFKQEWVNRPSEKGKGYKQFKRWEWFWEQRVGKSGDFPQGAVIAKEWDNYCQTHPKATLLNRQMPAFQRMQQESSATLSFPKGNWEAMGPNASPGGYRGIGRLNCMAFHPTDPNTFWVGSPAGGLWKTSDNGHSWTTYTDNLPVLGVSSIAIDYTNPNIIYIATGDGDNAYGIPGQPSAGYTQSVGVLKSTDGGITWAPTGLHWNVQDIYLIGTLLIHPVYPNVLVAATSDGVYKTENGGDTWQRTQSGHFQDMEFKPGEPSVIYASTFSWGGNAQIFKSSDTGSTWEQKTQFAGLLRIALAVTEAASDIVYAFCANTSDRGFGGFYKSENSGNTFALVYAKEEKNLLGWSSNGSDKGGQGWYDLSLAVSPTEQHTVFAGGVNTWKSTDGGKNWEINNVWYTTSAFPTAHADKHFLAFHPNQFNTLFEGNDGGLYKTTDGGSSWNDLSNGLEITQFYRLGLSATQPNLVLGGAQDNGTKKYINNTWVEASGGDGMECIIDYTNPDIMYGTSQNGILYRSTNGFASHTTISNNIPGNPGGAWVTPFIMDPNDPKTLYAGYNKVYKTTDRGDSWTTISDNFGGFPLQSMAIAPSNTQTLYAGSSYSLFATHDGGKSWQTLSNHLPNSSSALTYIAVHPEHPKTLWITYSGYVDGSKVFQSEDGGITWENISGTLPNLPVNCIVYQQGSAGGLYIGTDVGVFYKNQYMPDWEVFSEGLPNVIVTELEIQYEADKLRAATFGRGLWESDLLPPDPFVPVLESDSLALVALYNSTNGINWEKNRGWLVKPVREWEGIAVEGNRVKEISLPANNLKGNIPAKIGDLQQLEFLSLSDNQIGGKIPAEISKLKNLLFLYLNNNQIGGSFPTEIGILPRLKEVVLNNNQMSGKLPANITQLSGLSVLDISSNKFSATIPEDIGKLTALRLVYLNENMFTGKVPESLGNLSKLSLVNLSNNQLEGAFPELDHPIEGRLDISHNKFTSLPSFSGKINGTLNVAHNALTFEDILPNLGVDNFIYEPQFQIGEEKNITASEGDKFMINLSIDGEIEDNQYTWFKDQVEIKKITKNQFVIESIKFEDAGTYTCKITNTKAKGLTLQSKPVTLTIDHRSQFITLSDIPDNKTYNDPPFAISATASSGLPVKYILVSGPATLTDNILTVKGVGTITIRIEQAGNEDFLPAEPIEQSFQVLKDSQSINFATLEKKVFGDAPFALSATSNADLPVTFAVVSGPATLEGKTLSITGAGVVTVRAEQPGNENYKAAEPVEQNFEVEKAAQTITFSKPEEKTYLDAPFSLEGTASSGLPVSFSTISGPATLEIQNDNTTTVTLTGAGNVKVLAQQSGNENYKAAPSIEQEFKVNKAAQSVTFPEIDNKSPLDPPFDLEALATSGLEVNFVVLSGPATLDRKTLTLTGAGEVAVRAEQSGDENFLAANPVTQKFLVLKGFQQISFPPLSDRIFGDAPFELTATASSDLPVLYSIISGPATLDDNLLILTGAGEVSIRAEQPGDSDFEPATPVEQSFIVEKGFQTITFDEIPDKTLGDSAFAPAAISSADLPVIFTVVSGPARMENQLIRLTGAGEVSIRAEQPGDESYKAAEPVEQSFTVAKGTQIITFGAIPDKPFDETPFVPNATTSSGLPLSFTVIAGPAGIQEGKVHITGTGEVIIIAEQAGNDDFFPAEAVVQSFEIHKAAQTISFEPIPQKNPHDEPFALSATASSGLPVSFKVDAGPASVAKGIVTLSGESGKVTITATQEGNENYEPAPEVQQSFTVITRKEQTITFHPVADHLEDDLPFPIEATASSDLPVTFEIVSGPATLEGNTITLNGTGTVVVRASQEGNDEFLPAEAVEVSFEVEKVTGIEDEIARAGLKIFPNPAETQLNIEADFARWKGAHISIQDAVGKDIAQAQLRGGKLSIDLTGVSAGLYMLLIRKEQDFFVFRFMKD